MKVKIIFIICLILLASRFQKLQSQTQFNFNYEQIDFATGKPTGLLYWGTNDYKIGVDSIIKQNGKYALSIASSQDTKDKSFSSCVFVIPAEYHGNKIELKGYVKTKNVSDGWAGLFMRLDDKTTMVHMDNMQTKGIKGTTDWHLYSINLPLNKEINKIYAGVIFVGKGKAWFDNLQILINGKEISNAKSKYKADWDSSFYTGSNINITDLNKQNIENLSIVCKIWGFLKYYHPVIAKGDYNWDFELFRILPKIINCKNKEERSNILYDWIEKLGKIEKCNTCSDAALKDSKMLPDLDWINNKILFSDKIINMLQYIRDNRNQDYNYYILFDNIGRAIFKKENPYQNMLYPDEGFRLLSLFRYWNIIQYCFPYKYAIGENWHKVLEEFVPKFITAKNALEYRLTVLELIARIHDTHANIIGNDSIMDEYKGKYTSALQIEFIEGKAVVSGYLNEELGKKTLIEKGDIISKINGVSIRDIVKMKLPLTPASNETTQLREIALSLLWSQNDKIKIDYIKDGKEFNTEIDCYSFNKINPLINSYKYHKKDTCAKFIKDDIGYIYSGNIKNEYLPQIMDTFKDTKGIIIDLRCYPTDFLVFSLGEYLMHKPIEFVKFSTVKMNYLGLFKWDTPLKVGKINNNPYRGKIVILINEKTQSQAEYSTMAFRCAQNSIVIGNTTAGADGNATEFFLPGGIDTRISGLGVYYPDGRETQRIGIIPDIEVKPTIKGIKEGRDKVLEKAIEIIRNSN